MLEDERPDLTPDEQQREWRDKARGKAFALLDRVRKPRNVSRQRLASVDLKEIAAWLKREDPRLIVGEEALRNHLVEYVMAAGAEPVL